MELIGKEEYDREEFNSYLRSVLSENSKDNVYAPFYSDFEKMLRWEGVEERNILYEMVVRDFSDLIKSTAEMYEEIADEKRSYGKKMFYSFFGSEVVGLLYALLGGNNVKEVEMVAYTLMYFGGFGESKEWFLLKMYKLAYMLSKIGDEDKMARKYLESKGINDILDV